jgi:hypothetical protein
MDARASALAFSTRRSGVQASILHWSILRSSATQSQAAEALPWLVECEAEILVVPDRALKMSTSNWGAKDVTRDSIAVVVSMRPFTRRTPGCSPAAAADYSPSISCPKHKR